MERARVREQKGLGVGVGGAVAGGMGINATVLFSGGDGGSWGGCQGWRILWAESLKTFYNKTNGVRIHQSHLLSTRKAEYLGPALLTLFFGLFSTFG